MSEIFLNFLSDLPRLFRYVRHLAIKVRLNYSFLKAFLQHIAKIGQKTKKVSKIKKTKLSKKRY